jgi:hypothetical protein
MEHNKDFEDLLLSLNSAKAKFMLVGAYAVIYHTEPRYTKDLDIWIQSSEANAKKVLAALNEFGAPVKNISIADLTNPRMVYQIGIEPNRIDILMGISGVEFLKAWKRRKSTHYGNARVHILCIEDLILNKKTAGRPSDLLDVERLKEKLKFLKSKT